MKAINDGLTPQQRYNLKNPKRSTEYYKNNRDKCLESSRKSREKHKEKNKLYDAMYRKTIDRKYVHLKARSKRKGMDFTISKKDFSDWFSGQEKICHYCHIDIEICHKNKRQWLSFDRMDNKKPYAKDNVVLSCYRCNEVKSNDISYLAMIEIGKIIKLDRQRGCDEN